MMRTQINLTNDLALFVTSWLLQYRNLVDYSRLESEITVAMMLVGDFIVYEDDRRQIERKLAKTLKLGTLINNYLAEQTIPSDSCIDLTFSRHMHHMCHTFCYPVINKTSGQLTQVIEILLFFHLCEKVL